MREKQAQLSTGLSRLQKEISRVSNSNGLKDKIAKAQRDLPEFLETCLSVNEEQKAQLMAVQREVKEAEEKLGKALGYIKGINQAKTEAREKMLQGLSEIDKKAMLDIENGREPPPPSAKSRLAVKISCVPQAVAYNPDQTAALVAKSLT